MRRKTVVLVSRVDNLLDRKLQQLHYSISRNTESQQSREPDKLQEKGSLCSEGNVTSTDDAAPGSIAYSFARTIVCVKARPGEIYPKSLSV
jgi:hypothetical protein